MKALSLLSCAAGSFFMSCLSAFAQGETAADFLLIEPGARAGGMGNAHAAVVNDASAIYWNPQAWRKFREAV